MNVLFTRSTSIMFIICPSKSDEIIIEKIDGEDDKLGSHVRPHSLPISFSDRSDYHDVVEWTFSDINRENLLAILPEKIDFGEIGNSYWPSRLLIRNE